MKTTYRIKIDLIRKGVTPVTDVMQNDANSRVVEITLLENGAAWTPPVGTTFALSYGKPDGTKGFYSTLPGGNDAISADGNIVSVTLAPQVLTVAGVANAALVMSDPDANRISAFPFEIHVMADPAAGSVASEDYFPQGNAVLYTPQALTEAQQAQARANLGLGAATYLFNGLELPPLPAWDKASYPYAWIRGVARSDGTVRYYLRVFSQPLTYRYDGALNKTYVIYNPGSGILFDYKNGEWVQFGDEAELGNYFPVEGFVTSWVNHDVINEADGTVYQAASEPVPVYDGGAGDALRYTQQTLTEAQKAQARANIGVGVTLPVVELSTTLATGVTLTDEENAALTAAYESGLAVVVKCKVDDPDTGFALPSFSDVFMNMLENETPSIGVFFLGVASIVFLRIDGIWQVIVAGKFE